ncbi:CYTH domain-containing protein [Alteribacter aurantiacus]|uniref:CYTH domain-containing protein n=1 Tax=Alteribacter aurantiacus TaxID=254410 RepID=UPI0004119554|nr:CYTH domain-containing protein [Alteribacter aurantiacus]
MNQEIEIEFKNLLTKEEYIRLKHAFFETNDQPFSQSNHYFDTADLLLKDNGSALRIRKKNDRYVLTLKQPLETGLLETHQTITKHEAEIAFKNGSLPLGDVINHLKKTLPVTENSFTFLGSLATDRLEKDIPGGLLVLDKSSYLNETDYELEFECTNADEGKKVFHSLLQDYDIQKKDTESKIHRFFNTLHHQ